MVGRVVANGLMPKHGSRMSLDSLIQKDCTIKASIPLECKYLYSSKRDAAAAARVIRGLGYLAHVLPVGALHGVFTSKKKMHDIDYSVVVS